VPASEAEQIIAAMRRAGHNPWYLLARNEGHGFQRQSNRLARAEAETLFLQKVLTPARQ
jgi:dipeptidyl aminopeptidase/acylaminoacyl peptidase